MKYCESIHQKFIEIENKHRTIEHNICYSHIERLKHDEEEVTVIPTKCYSYYWTPQFLHKLPEVATIKSDNKNYNKIAHLKSKTK